jgi:hypothetical protein
MPAGISVKEREAAAGRGWTVKITYFSELPVASLGCRMIYYH